MKRLIVCCDGTWQDLDCKCPTNVVKIAQAIKTIGSGNVPQMLYYSEGIGTGPDKLDRLMGGAFGLGIDQRIQSAYRFLCCNYEDGDEIYLFGFSRGAYTVRSLAGLIYKCGILKRRYIRQIKDAYKLYRKRETSPSDPEAVNFRQQFTVHPQNEAAGTQIPITLLACWDTVGELGVPNTLPLLSHLLNKKYQFYDTRVNPKIQHALHAAALDERRSAFEVTHMVPHEDRDENQVSEVWFSGVHGCVGGGTQQTLGLSNIPLKWMMEKIRELGLGLEFVDNPNAEVEGGIKIDPSTVFDSKIKGIYRLMPAKDRVLIDPSDLKTQLNQDFFEHRIHSSVKERWRLANLNPLYRPQPLLKLKEWFDAMVQ
jgi:uncharacterized protein (DUF2235 family)